jgi:SNF2 family DNA or RNA helicase
VNAFAAGAEQPRNYQLFGEIHADGHTLVLFGLGDLTQVIGRLHLLTPHFAQTPDGNGLQIELRWPVVVQLAGEFGSAWRPGPRLQAWIYEQVQLRNAAPELTVSVNEGAPEPRSYQITGARLIAAGLSALVCDDPGTGKTLTTLLGLMQLRANGALPLAGPILVVCPASVIDPWIEAARRWTPFRVAAWRGAAATRRRLLDARNDILVTSYGTAAKDADPAEPDRLAPLRRLAPAALVIDECHLIKNPSSLRSKAVRALGRRALSVIPLSGTPITHHTGDLHPTLQAMDHVSWPSSERYVARYLDSVPGDYTENVLGINAAREPEFRMTLHGQYRRLAKADVLAELPEKVYSTRTVTLPPAARKAYDAMARDMLAELDNGQEVKAFDVVVQLQRLLQLACASADVSVTHGPDVDELTGEPKEHTHVHLREPSWKVDALMEVLDERPGKSVLVFAPSRQLVVLGGERAAKEGRRVGYVIGAQSAKERTAQVAAFQSGELDVMCATTGAGGVGITLTAASTVVFLQRPWSFNDALQAEDRAHRMGSEIHDSIEIIDIVAEKTIDAQVRDVIRSKAGALAELLQDQRIVSQFLGGR